MFSTLGCGLLQLFSDLCKHSGEECILGLVARPTRLAERLEWKQINSGWSVKVPDLEELLNPGHPRRCTLLPLRLRNTEYSARQEVMLLRAAEYGLVSVGGLKSILVGANQDPSCGYMEEKDESTSREGDNRKFIKDEVIAT